MSIDCGRSWFVIGAVVFSGAEALAQAFDACITSSPSSINERFGREIDIDGAFLITGAPGPNEFTASLPGAAFIHRRTGAGAWEQEAQLMQPDPAA